MRTMRKMGMREGLIGRCEEVLKKTRSKMKVGVKEGASSWTWKGVRQGCPLSPTLFILLMADLEEEMRRGGWGGMRVSEEKIYILAYADDVAVMAEDEDGIRGLMDRMERYLDEKGLELNTEKTKMLRCRKGGGRWRRRKW